MIPFHRACLEDKAPYESILMNCPERGCEYSFANLFLWGRQEIAFVENCVVFFSHFFGRSVYPYPLGIGDKKAALEAILADSRQRGIPCRITGMTEADRQELEDLFPDRFSIRPARDSFDYVYTVDALADLKGKPELRRALQEGCDSAAGPEAELSDTGYAGGDSPGGAEA